MIYTMSDSHGYLDILRQNIEKIDLSGDNRLILLGDYIDRGPKSGQTLRYIYDLQQKHGAEKVIVLRGNHEDDFLDWIDTISHPDGVSFNNWLAYDRGLTTFRTLVTAEQLEEYKRFAADVKGNDLITRLNEKAVQMILETSGDLIKWMRNLPYYYKTETQIFVHAGIDEEAEEWWETGTPKFTFVGKPFELIGTGEFYMDIIAGHIGTSRISGDENFHGVFHDGKSHYYIDGTVVVSGKIPVLKYDEESRKYIY